MTNIHEIYSLFKKNKTKHWPIRRVSSDVYEITLREEDPMISYLLLKYKTG